MTAKVFIVTNNKTMSASDHPDSAAPKHFDSSILLSEPAGGLPEGTEVLAIPDASELMGVVVTKVFDMLRNKQILAVRVNGVRYLPARFLNDSGELNKFVPGLIALLGDGGYEPEEILSFLYTEDDSLPGRPVDALHGHLAREVRRRAQAMALI